MVTEGNWPWWLTTSGASARSNFATLDSGTCAPPAPRHIDARQVAGIALELRVDLQDRRGTGCAAV